MRSVVICLVVLLAVLASSSVNAQCFSSAAKIRSGSLGLFGTNNVVVAQPVVQSFVAQPFVAQQLIVPQSTSFFAGGNVAFLNTPAAIVGHQAFVVQQQRVRNQRQRQGIFGNLFNNNRQQKVIVHQPRVQNVVVGHSRLLIR